MPSTNHLRQIFRRLRRAPGFAAVSLLTLALGMGATLAVFSVVDGVLLEPLPYPEPDRLVGLWHEAPGLGFDQVNQSPANYFTYREQGTDPNGGVFVDVGLWDDGQVSITGLDEPEEVRAMFVTDGTLPILGAETVRGRLFAAADDQPEAARVALVSHGYWQSRLAGDPDAVGRTLRIDGESHEIIGVMGEGFRVLDRDVAVYLPFRFDRSQVRMGNFSYQGLARLQPGVSLEQAHAEVARLIPIAVETFPGGISLEMVEQVGFAPKIHLLEVDVVGDIGKTLWVILGTVGLVLLIACANVANLFLVRAEARQIEIAVRQALGADRRAVLFERLSESLTLALGGGIAGLGLAELGLRLLRTLRPTGLPRIDEIAIDADAIWLTLGLSLVAGLVLGLAPSVRRGGSGLVSALREGGRGGSVGKERLHARNLLVVGQIAMALMLLVGSGLLVRSILALSEVRPGFDKPEEILTLRLGLPEAEVAEVEAVVTTFERFAEELGAIPGVVSIGASASVPMDGWDSNDTFYVEDFPTPEGQLPPIRRFEWVSGNFFETQGNPLVAGRTITWDDVRARTPVLVITENLAAELWGSPTAALGKRVRQSPEGEWREIVGVVGNVHDDGVDQDAVPMAFWPMAMANFWEEELFVRRSMVFSLRVDRPIGPELLADVRQVVWGINPNVPLANVRSMEEIYRASMARTSFTIVMLGLASAIALLLGFVGIFGVTSYVVAERTREIGVRMALGARGADVGFMVLRQTLILAAIGVGLGLIGAAALSRTLSALLFGVGALDPVTYAVVSLLLVAFALLAGYIPARRASKLDPLQALRFE